MKGVTGLSSLFQGPGIRRYTTGAQAFHWVTAVLMFAVIPLGWIFAEFKTKDGAFEAPFPGTPDTYASLHKTIGLVILAIVVARIVYRIVNPPPVLPGRMAAWARGLSTASHWLLYAVLIVMPVSGYVMSSASTHPISVVGLFDVPKLPISKAVGADAHQIHLFVQWAVYALILLHVLATAWHLLVRRDAILDRMLPRQVNAE